MGGGVSFDGFGGCNSWDEGVGGVDVGSLDVGGGVLFDCFGRDGQYLG